MSGFYVSRYHDISTGHRVCGHESKCAHLHGHNYRIHFKCLAMPPRGSASERSFFGMSKQPTEQKFDGLDQLGRVIDFGVVKDTLCAWLEEKWDHKFLLYKEDPILAALQLADPDGVVAVPFNPTAENMARYLVEVIGPMLLDHHNIMLAECVIEETRKCTAGYVL